MEKLRVFEAFAGYGSQSVALRNIDADYDVVGISEIDIDAIIAYACLRYDLNIDIDVSEEVMRKELMDKNVGWDFKNQKSRILKMKKDKLKMLYIADKLSKNFGDISILKPETIPDHDLFTFSFPCQDISIAGKQASLKEGSGTRSSLLWECKKIIENKKPKYLLMENVKNLISKKHKPYFDKWLEYLESLGYTNYWKVLNAKDFGIPQNRERVFCVSILNNCDFEMSDFESKTGDLQLFLESGVNIKTKPSCEKAFENEFDEIIKSDKEIYQCNVKSGFQDCKIGLKVAPTLRANNSYTHVLQYKFPEGVELKNTIFDLLEKDVDDKYYLSEKGIKKMMRFAPKGSITDFICPTLTTELSHSSGKNLYPKLCKIIAEYRRITPKEAFRLMGLNDEDIDRIQLTGISDTQQYKLAGNSIVIQVLEAIFKELFKI